MGAVIQIAGHEESNPPIRMLDGFNDGWIEFENGDAGSRRGEVALKSVLLTLVEREGIRPIPAAVPVSHN
jgi:NAD(P)H dehydrogenase (quinone)